MKRTQNQIVLANGTMLVPHPLRRTNHCYDCVAIHDNELCSKITSALHRPYSCPGAWALAPAPAVDVEVL